MNQLTLPQFLLDLLRNMMAHLPARRIVRERNMKRKESQQKSIKPKTPAGQKESEKKDIIRTVRKIKIPTVRN